MKNWIQLLLTGCLASIAPIKAIIISVGILVLADLITGIFAAIKKKEKITAHKMRQTIPKIIVYEIAIITGFILEKYLLKSLIPISNLTAGVIGLVEFKSILENCDHILGHKTFKAIFGNLNSTNILK